MHKLILTILLFIFLLLQNGCITPEVSADYNFYALPKDMHRLNIAVMPIIPKELSESEIEEINEEITDALLTYSTVKKVIPPEVTTEILLNKDLLNEWQNCWHNYITKEKLDSELLKQIGDELNVNAVIQFEIIDIKKIRPVHRQVIGGTTAEVKYKLFSTTNCYILSEATAVATQKNAWSGQMTPRPIEAIEAAIEEIIENLPF